MWGEAMCRIIIDCDPGNGIPGANVDDGLAIGLALASKNICLELITIVAGNTPRDVGYHVAKNMISELGLSIPIVKGAEKAILEPSKPWRDYLNSSFEKKGCASLWKDIATLRLKKDNLIPKAAETMAKLVCQNPGEITIVAIGPLTNIAQAIQLYPEFTRSVAKISIMGGVFQLNNYLKDTNFGMDPEAAKIVLESGANITLAPLDVTTKTLLTHKDLDKLQRFDNPLSQYLVKTMRPWLSYSMKTRGIDGCWIHDALSVAVLIDPNIVSMSPYVVDVALGGDFTRGSARRWKKDAIRLTVGMPKVKFKPINVIETVNNKRLISLIFSAVKCFPNKC